MAFLDSIKWQGKSIRDFVTEVTEVKGRGQPMVSHRRLRIPGRHGEFTFGAKYEPRIIEISGHISGTSHADMIANINSLKDLFAMNDNIIALGNEQLSDVALEGKLEFGDETDRYYKAVFDGVFILSDISHRWMLNDLIKFTIRFLCHDPFKQGNFITSATMDGSADEFKVFDTGTADSDSRITINGAVTNPVIVSGDKVGVAHFDNNDDLRDVENTLVAGNFSPLFGFRGRKALASQQSKAIQINAKDNLFWDRGAQIDFQNYVNFNPYQGTLIVWVKPYWDGDDSILHQVFHSNDSSDNNISLIKSSSNVLFFEVKLGGTTVSISSAVLDSANFGAGKWHQIVARWDINNGISGTANTVELEINQGTPVTTTTALGTPNGLDAFFAIGQNYSTTPDGSTNIFDGLIHFQIYERALTDAELDALFNSGAGVEPFVDPDTKLLLAGELDGSDLPVAVQYPYVDNLVENGNQEDDPIAGWQEDIEIATIRTANRVKYDTASTVVLVGGGTPVDDNKFAWMEFTAVNNDDYFYRFQINVDDIDISPNINLVIEGTGTILTRQLNTGTDDRGISYVVDTWLYYEGTFKSDITGTIKMQFTITGAGVNANSGAFYVDQLDVQLNLIDNPSFEGVYAGGLAPEWFNQETSIPAEENVIVHSGGASQKITGSGSLSGVTAVPTTSAANTWHAASIWARGASGGEALRIRMLNYAGILGVSDASFVLTTTWTKYTIMFKIAGDVGGGAAFTTNDGDVIYLDDASIIELDEVSANSNAGATPEVLSYSDEKYNQGLRIDGGDGLSWSAIGNKNEGSISIWLRPLFAADWDDDTDDPIIFEYDFDSANDLKLSYDWTADKWSFNKRVASVSRVASSDVQSFAAGDRIHIMGTYGANGVKIYIDSVIGGTINANTDALAGNPITFRMREAGTGLRPDSIIDEVVAYSRELSQQEVTDVFNRVAQIKNDNRVFGITRELETNDRERIESETETVEFTDVSEGTITNDIASMNTGSQFPKLSENKAVIYNKEPCDDIDIKYRKRYL